ncbi:hypothetical protein LINPERPRIM_LOCUS23219 [Linum perenne]
MQRLIVVELHSISCEVRKEKEICWSNELYPGEFEQLKLCSLYSKETDQPVQPRLMEMKSNINTESTVKFVGQPSSDTLQVKQHTFFLMYNFPAAFFNELHC